ncbi:10906_t:CDS:2 [Scutellospora calospora]|uniref:10906_t:CDS:1 n=1 Tax=Scutellospora calospora TaxID=85575 RepID=A0ACA9JZS7_9GLOM|nr:10906_t:CDS:2 [Scutellospora calospora]
MNTTITSAINLLREQTRIIDLTYQQNIDLLENYFSSFRGPLPKVNGKKLFGLVFNQRCDQAGIAILPKEAGEYVKVELWKSSGPAERYQ